MECKFYVGQKVVCVTASVNAEPSNPQCGGRVFGLREGETYTVSGLLKASRGVVVQLVEVKNPESPHHGHGYSALRFRPAVETQTDISALKQIVEDVKNGKIKEYAE